MKKNTTQKKTNAMFGVSCLAIAIALIASLFTGEQKPTFGYWLLLSLLIVIALLLLFVPPASASEAHQRELNELVEICKQYPDFLALTDLYATFDAPEDVSRATRILTELIRVKETTSINNPIENRTAHNNCH